MTAAGNPATWAEQFRSFDTRFLERVVAVWPRCCAVLSSQSGEDEITTNLVDFLWQDPQVRRQFYVEYQFEPFGHKLEGTAFSKGKISKGKIDMAVVLDRNREKYLAYECKCLNVVRNSKRKPQATDYVMKGLLRFVTEQYAENLPVGCMLSYVLDGDVPFAYSKVQDAIEAKKDNVKLVGMSIRDMPTIGFARRFSSEHIRLSSGTVIEIRHALLAFPAA